MIMRGRKGSVFSGGVRVPFYLRYPAKLKGNKDIETTAAHMDILPTLSEICGVKMPEDRKIDGKNLAPLLTEQKVLWEDRSLFFYWTRRYPELYQNMALQRGPYKLVAHVDYDSPIDDYELFNIQEDPYEQDNLVQKSKEIAVSLKAEMDLHYNDLIQSSNLLNPPHIQIGSEYENPVFLNRNDAGGERGIWDQEEIYGKWSVSLKEGLYNVKFRFVKPLPKGGKMYMETGAIINQKKNDKEDIIFIEMQNIHLPNMECDLIKNIPILGQIPKSELTQIHSKLEI